MAAPHKPTKNVTVTQEACYTTQIIDALRRSTTCIIQGAIIMKTLVITGATRGIGYGLALEFLKRNHNVIISGRTQEAVDKAVDSLKSAAGSDTVFGIASDVRILEQVQSLWQASAEKFGTVDIWINNAGIGHGVINSWEIPIERVKAIFDTNILGTYHIAH